MSDNYMDSFFDKLEAEKGSMSGMSELKSNVRTAWEFPPQSRVVLASDYDALAQRCRELEQCMSEPLNKLIRERDTLRAEVERLTLYIEKAQQHALTMGSKALELAGREIELKVEVEQLRKQAAISRLKAELPAT